MEYLLKNYFIDDAIKQIRWKFKILFYKYKPFFQFTLIKTYLIIFWSVELIVIK